MGALERAKEWLRPFVKTKEWDYCVIWKLGDDPSRFIEWIDCCCGGGIGGNAIKEEKGVDSEKVLFPLCRDAHFQHQARTKSCKTLAQYPSSMPLYSGIHGDVAISNQQMWLTHGSSSNSNKSVGTHVIIPVGGGLIELFSTKNVPKDQKLIDFIAARYTSLEQEMLTNIFKRKPHDPFVGEHSNNQYDSRNIPMLQNFLPASPYFNIEGSSTGSSPSYENPSLKSGSGHASPNGSPNISIGKSSRSLKLNCKHELPRNEKIRNHVNGQKDELKGRQRTEKEPHQSKNLQTERNRRKRINNGLFALRALVPNISKMDRAAILGDAIDYIKDLKKEIELYQSELRELEELECSNYNAVIVSHETSTNADQMQQMEVQMEINKIGAKGFLLKLIHNKQRRGFSRLMEAMHSLGLQVVDANVHATNGRVMNILHVEAHMEDVDTNNLKDSLLNLLEV